MNKSWFRRGSNRCLHLLARFLPGANSLRPRLHRLRGVKIGEGVFIGEDVYLENDYPEAVEIQDGVQISVRATIMAHTRGAGKVVLERDAFLGANCVVATSGGRTLRIGEGAVIAAGVVITSDVPAHAFVAGYAAKPVASARVPFTRAATMEDFVRGLVPLRQNAKPATSVTTSATTKHLNHEGQNGEPNL